MKQELQFCRSFKLLYFNYKQMIMQENLSALEKLDFPTTISTRIVENRGKANRKGNGVHKYLKKYLRLYDWKDREKLIVAYTFGKTNPVTGRAINKMKQRYVYIQANFDDFVLFLKQQTGKNAKNSTRNTR